MRLLIYCFVTIVIVTSCISSLIPTKPPTITFVTKPQSDVLEIPPQPAVEESTDNYDQGYEQGYQDKQDEIDE